MTPPIACSAAILLALPFALPLVACAGTPVVDSAPQAAPEHRTLWYAQPAKSWAGEALPIGNARMGAMLFGGVKDEVVQFNEQSLWSGANDWDGGYNLGDTGFGTYKNFGSLALSFQGDAKAPLPADYRRALDISTGIHRTSFTQNGAAIVREAFASRPDQVIVLRYGADKPGSFSGTLRLNPAHKAQVSASGKGLALEGALGNKLKFAAGVRVLHTGGSVKAVGETVVFERCDTLTLLLDARTDYAPDFKAGWRGADPAPAVARELAAAEGKSFDALRLAHLGDLAPMLARARADWGATDPAVMALPTDARIRRYADVAAGNADPDLEETMFQYGRYLIASCSRPGGLPANLQGLWNDSNNPAWASDYHNNINIQMNYWGVESTGLPECHEPLLDYVVAQAEPCRIATRRAFGEKTRGWTARTSQSIFGGNGWEWNIPASAWYAQHFAEHYAFTQDREYLRKQGYPAVKEICEFWEDHLKKLPDGTLVAPNGWSPEHGPHEDGVMMDQQLIWDLFQNYLDLAKVLGVDADYQKKVAGMRDHLAQNKVGKWGQLQEWQVDRDDPRDTHRHSSHLFAVYPGRQINPAQTPELAKAAIFSLKARSNDHEIEYGGVPATGKPFGVDTTVGDSRREWAFAWRTGIWARLGEGERAGMMLRGLLTYSVTPNLFCTHPPFQMDGNFGISGTVPEMLLQSHAGEIALLPACPKEWLKQGSFAGLRARGGYRVDCAWKDGRVVSYRIVADKAPDKSAKVRVRVNGQVKEVAPE